MNDSIRMSVSTVTRTKDKKAVYVLFQDEGKSAEFALPECELVKNDGFSEEDIGQLLEYVRNEKNTIFDMAKQINPMKSFFGDIRK